MPSDLRVRVAAEDATIEYAREQQSAAADRRAHLIADAVAAHNTQHGRGGRDAVAGELGVNVLQVDKALRRAREADRPHGLPGDLLDRLYVLELPTLTDDETNALRRLLAGTFIDAAWVEQPGELLAQEAEDAAGEELDEGTAKALAAAARSWTRVQALAVIDACKQRKP